MKIFNWVHRRFNSRAAENGKKTVGIGGEDEEKGNVLEHWRGGILTIGTFGYDPLKDESCDDDQINYDHVCNEEEEEEELAHVEHYHDDVDDDSEEDGEDDEDDEEDEEKPNLIFAGCYEEEEEDEEEKRSWELGYEYVMMEKKARTTLADLFLHAHEDTTATTTTTFNHDQLSKKTTKKKKKQHLLLDQVGPIHKLNKLMRRMLKRKIHPADIGAHISKVVDINDHASLLIPTHHQDVII